MLICTKMFIANLFVVIKKTPQNKFEIMEMSYNWHHKYNWYIESISWHQNGRYVDCMDMRGSYFK